MEQRIETHILCAYGGRHVVASTGTAQLWGRIHSCAISDKPNFHAVGAYMAIRGLLAQPNNFDTQTRHDNQRVKVKIERGYELYYTLLPDGDIYLNDIQIDFEDETLTQGDKKSYLYKISSSNQTSDKNKALWRAQEINVKELKIDPSSVTHILVGDTKVEDAEKGAIYGAPVINSGHPGHEVNAGDTFYMFHYPKKRGLKGFVKSFEKTEPVNKKDKFVNEIASVVAGAARISAAEYQRRKNSAEKATQKLANNDKAAAHLVNTNFGNISTKNRDDIIKEKNVAKAQKAKALNIAAAKKVGLPDPVVCWTVNGNGDKVFKTAVERVAANQQFQNYYHCPDTPMYEQLNGRKLQHVFLNNYTVNDNRLDRAMSNIGMEWSEKRGTRSPVSLKNHILDGIFSSEYALLKRRTQISSCDQERAQLHPAFSATSKEAKSQAINNKAPLLSKHGMAGAGIRAGNAASKAAKTAGAAAALAATSELEAIVNSSGTLIEKASTVLHGTAGTIYKTVQVVSEIGASNPGATAVAGGAVVAFTIGKFIYSGALQKSKLLFGQMKHGDLSSMPTSSLSDLKTAVSFRSNYDL
ncbi:hypothetical protein [Marinibactrum halimedae]|uniref:Uncharacterized protein n=1 Tax=Marinibactrum halimedae TaxID=1444977 RepID=A0AA37WMH2_9GAMM|nr:hypothetical protein [Marinibactrum halimedae]MCD9460142.1 hypothetical protein [Marinibactrum halimedae]GLS26388.1 hypothetical protein GCM10007877_21030 [Marinibactrum halimedae]